ncbi:MAG: isoprenylcysteine carboxylmethyltransferase family protein [Anaerolineae bacterium]
MTERRTKAVDSSDAVTESGISTTRGETWVLVQIVLLALIGALPIFWRTATMPETLAILSRVLGILIGAVGALFGLVSALNLGSNLTVFPRPLENGKLVEHGIYGVVRHPMYCGVILLALGWSLLWANVPALILSLGLVIFFDRKAAQEEIWLAQKYSDYPGYKRRVRKLIPFIY